MAIRRCAGSLTGTTHHGSRFQLKGGQASDKTTLATKGLRGLDSEFTVVISVGDA